MFLRRSTSQIVYALRSYSIDRQGWPWPSALLLWATRLVPTAARRKPIVVAFGMSHHNRHQSLSLENGYDTSGLPNLRNAQCAGCRDFLQQGTGPSSAQPVRRHGRNVARSESARDDTTPVWNLVADCRVCKKMRVSKGIGRPVQGRSPCV